MFYAPKADVLFAADASWWHNYGGKVRWFRGERVSKVYNGPGVRLWPGEGWPSWGGNSGCMAIQERIDAGWRKIALLGFDFQHTDGKSHFHGDHPDHMGNAPRHHCAEWVVRMAEIAPVFATRGVEIVNLSRATALECFPRMTPRGFVRRIAHE